MVTKNRICDEIEGLINERSFFPKNFLFSDVTQTIRSLDSITEISRGKLVFLKSLRNLEIFREKLIINANICAFFALLYVFFRLPSFSGAEEKDLIEFTFASKCAISRWVIVTWRECQKEQSVLILDDIKVHSSLELECSLPYSRSEWTTLYCWETLRLKKNVEFIPCLWILVVRKCQKNAVNFNTFRSSNGVSP